MAKFSYTQNGILFNNLDINEKAVVIAMINNIIEQEKKEAKKIK